MVSEVADKDFSKIMTLRFMVQAEKGLLIQNAVDSQSHLSKVTQ